MSAYSPIPRPPNGPDGSLPAGSDHLPPDVLSDLLDGRLPADVWARATAHLGTCAHCRDERDALAQVVALGRHALPRVKAPADLWPLVAATTIHAAATRRHVLRSLRGVLAAAALALCAASAWLGVAVGRELERRERTGAVPVGDAPVPRQRGAAEEDDMARQMRELDAREREVERRAAEAGRRRP